MVGLRTGVNGRIRAGEDLLVWPGQLTFNLIKLLTHSKNRGYFIKVWVQG